MTIQSQWITTNRKLCDVILPPCITIWEVQKVTSSSNLFFFFFFFLDTSLLRVRVLGKGYWRTKWDHMPHFWLFSAPTMMILHNSLILHDLLPLPNVSQHLVLSWYTMSSRSSRANSRKQPITSFSALWIIQKCIFCDFWMIQHDAYHGQIVKTV